MSQSPWGTVGFTKNCTDSPEKESEDELWRMFSVYESKANTSVQAVRVDVSGSAHYGYECGFKIDCVIEM
jgi:hypothetical protein